MDFDVAELIRKRQGENYTLHQRLLNPQLANVLQTLGFDVCYERAEGCYLWDYEGQRYLDTLAGFGVFALGRNHPTIKSALHQALDLDLPNMVQIDCALLPGILAEELVGRAHAGIERAFFCNSGAEAVEAAIKFARQATKRTKIIYADHAFHGLSTGALALNGGKDFRRGFGPLLPETTSVPFGDAAALAHQLRHNDVAAFIVEPIQGKGVNMASQAYWTEVQALCREHKTLFIMDEVQTGLGRTGKFFAFEHWGLNPDIITVSKALSGGYVPVGAMLTSDRILRSVHHTMSQALKHSTTFGRNQLAMVAGLATLATFDEEGTVAHAGDSGARFMAALAPLVERYELFHEVRGKGLMIGIEFGTPTSPALRRRFQALQLMRKGLFSQAVVVPLFHRHRILTQVAADNVNVIKLIPPLIWDQPEIEAFVTALDDVLAAASEGNSLYFELGKQMVGGLRHRGA